MAPGPISDVSYSAAMTVASNPGFPPKYTSSGQLVQPAVAELHMSSYGSNQELVDDIAKSLKLSGGCIIRNMFPKSTLDAMESEIRPYISATKEADANRQDFVPSQTRMVTGLLSKSPTYAVSVVGNPVYQAVSAHFLTSTLSNSWHGTHQRTSVSAPQLSTTVAFSVGPGTPAQGLHRDDDIYHAYHPTSDAHHPGRDTMVCFFVAGTRCTAANGATRIVPGSHLWDYSRAPPPPSSSSSSSSYPSPFFHAEMSPGDAFLMLGGVYHGAGANSTAHQERLVYAAFSTRGYLRQEENQYLANDLAKIARLPMPLQRFAGFRVSKPFMGWVDLGEPVALLNEGEVGDGEFW